jgi:hypothetical protein
LEHFLKVLSGSNVLAQPFYPEQSSDVQNPGFFVLAVLTTAYTSSRLVQY